MPHAGPGQMLRAMRGGVGRRLVGADENVVVATGVGEGRNLLLCGTVNHLACAGILPYAPTASVRVAGGQVDDTYRVYLPTPRWGAAGSLTRTPRCLVACCPDMTTDEPIPGADAAVAYQREFADAVDGLAGRLTARGVTVSLVKNYFGFWPGGRGSPLLGPCLCTGGEAVVNNHGGDPYMAVFFGPEFTTAERFTGGDVFWASVGGAHFFDVGGYANAYIRGEVNSTPAVELPAGVVGWSSVRTESVASPDPPFDVFTTVTQYAIERTPLLRDAAQLLATAGRCRRFAFRWVSTDEHDEGLTGDDDALLDLLPGGINAATVRGSGSAAAATLVSQALDFFGE